jgi:DNA polymerase-3 subunit beta
MELIISKQNIEKLLVKLQGVSEKRHAIPVLSHFSLEAGNGGVHVTATDLDIIIRDGCEADVMEEGGYLIPTRKLLDVVRVLPTETVTLRLLESGFIELVSGKSRFKIAGLPMKEFPDLPGREKGEPFTVNASVLKLMIDRVLTFTSTEDTRLEVSGVLFEKVTEGKTERLRLVATDGHRLSYVEEYLEGLTERLGEGIIVPRKGVSELRKMVDESSGDVTISVGESFLSASTDGSEITIRLIGAEFPSYREVIPTNFTRKLVVDREKFAEVLRRVSVIATEKLKSVIMNLKSNEMEVSSVSPDYGEASDFIDVSMEGEEMKIGFNSRYLLDVATSSGGENLVVHISNELSPVLFMPEGRDDFIAVVMPIRTAV